MGHMQPFCMDIQVETHPNPDVRTFHFRPKLVNDRDYVSDMDEPHEKPVLTGAMIRKLRAIFGIKEVSCWPYQITISRAPLYTWEELAPAIKLVMATYYPSRAATFK